MDIISPEGHNINELYKTHPHHKGSLESESPKVLSLPVDDGGCGWYRVRQLLQEFERQKIASTLIFSGKESEAELAQAIEAADVIIARNGTAPFVKGIKTTDPDKPIVFDHDDNTFEILPSNEHYRHHGVEDVVIETENGDHELWITGRDGFNRYENLWKRSELEYLLRASDLNTSPTEHLSEYWAGYNGKAAVVPNAIDFNIYPEVQIKDPSKGSEVRIGWQGGVSHAGDFEAVSKPLRKLMHENKDVYFYTVGSSYDWFFKGYESRVRTFYWLPFKAHPYRMATLDLDIAIIPLEDRKFNDYKSEVKFSEFAALGVPCLVADRLPYSVVCKDGENCLTYKTMEEFNKKIRMLIKDKKLRDRLAHNAKKWVRAERDLAKIAPKVLETYLEL